MRELPNQLEAAKANLDAAMKDGNRANVYQAAWAIVEMADWAIVEMAEKLVRERDDVQKESLSSIEALAQERDTLRAKLDDLLSQRMDEAEAKLATRLAEAVVEELQAENRRLREGYRLLAEAVEAKAELDEAVEEYVKARKSPLQIDPERTNALGQRGIEMQTRYNQAQAKALAHLRGVGRE